MRIINVIVVKNNVVDSIESFGIFEEQLSDEVVKAAEKDFLTKCINLGADIELIDDYIEDGYFEDKNINTSVSRVWSDIE